MPQTKKERSKKKRRHRKKQQRRANKQAIEKALEENAELWIK